MRKMWLFDGIFWGVFLVALGVWIMVRRYLPVNIPIARIIFAAIFVYLGVRILVMGGPGIGIRDRNTVVFSNTHMNWSSDTRANDYNIIFSSGSVDLSGLTPSGGNVYKEVNVVFGSGTLRINPTVPVQIDMTGVFGTVRSPNGYSSSFRETVYSSPAYKAGEAAVRIKATAIFGTLNIEEVARLAPDTSAPTVTPEKPAQ